MTIHKTTWGLRLPESLPLLLLALMTAAWMRAIGHPLERPCRCLEPSNGGQNVTECLEAAACTTPACTDSPIWNDLQDLARNSSGAPALWESAVSGCQAAELLQGFCRCAPSSSSAEANTCATRVAMLAQDGNAVGPLCQSPLPETDGSSSAVQRLQALCTGDIPNEALSWSEYVQRTLCACLTATTDEATVADCAASQAAALGVPVCELWGPSGLWAILGSGFDTVYGGQGQVVTEGTNYLGLQAVCLSLTSFDEESSDVKTAIAGLSDPQANRLACEGRLLAMSAGDGSVPGVCTPREETSPPQHCSRHSMAKGCTAAGCSIHALQAPLPCLRLALQLTATGNSTRGHAKSLADVCTRSVGRNCSLCLDGPGEDAASDPINSCPECRMCASWFEGLSVANVSWPVAYSRCLVTTTAEAEEWALCLPQMAQTCWAASSHLACAGMMDEDGAQVCDFRDSCAEAYPGNNEDPMVPPIETACSGAARALSEQAGDPCDSDSDCPEEGEVCEEAPQCFLYACEGEALARGGACGRRCTPSVPTALSAQIEPGWGTLTVRLSVPGAAGSGLCSDILGGSAAARLGSAAFCQVAGRLVTVRLGGSPNISAGSTLSISVSGIGDNVQLRSLTGKPFEGSVTVQGPAGQQQERASQAQGGSSPLDGAVTGPLLAPGGCGKHDGMLLDATGVGDISGLRQVAQVRWVAAEGPTKAMVQKLQEALDAAAGGPSPAAAPLLLLLPTRTLAGGLYRVNASAVLETGEGPLLSSIAFEILAGGRIPLVYILGGAVQAFPLDAGLVLTGHGPRRRFHCREEAVPVRYLWRDTSPRVQSTELPSIFQLGATEVHAESREISIPGPVALLPLQPRRLTLEAFPVGSSNLTDGVPSSSADVTVVGLTPPLAVQLEGPHGTAAAGRDLEFIGQWSGLADGDSLSAGVKLEFACLHLADLAPCVPPQRNASADSEPGDAIFWEVLPGSGESRSSGRAVVPSSLLEAGEEYIVCLQAWTPSCSHNRGKELPPVICERTEHCLELRITEDPVPEGHITWDCSSSRRQSCASLPHLASQPLRLAVGGISGQEPDLSFHWWSSHLDLGEAVDGQTLVVDPASLVGLPAAAINLNITSPATGITSVQRVVVPLDRGPICLQPAGQCLAVAPSRDASGVPALLAVAYGWSDPDSDSRQQMADLAGYQALRGLSARPPLAFEFGEVLPSGALLPHAQHLRAPFYAFTAFAFDLVEGDNRTVYCCVTDSQNQSACRHASTPANIVEGSAADDRVWAASAGAAFVSSAAAEAMARGGGLDSVLAALNDLRYIILEPAASATIVDAQERTLAQLTSMMEARSPTPTEAAAVLEQLESMVERHYMSCSMLTQSVTATDLSLDALEEGGASGCRANETQWAARLLGSLFSPATAALDNCPDKVAAAMDALLTGTERRLALALGRCFAANAGISEVLNHTNLTAAAGVISSSTPSLVVVEEEAGAPFSDAGSGRRLLQQQQDEDGGGGGGRVLASVTFAGVTGDQCSEELADSDPCIVVAVLSDDLSDFAVAAIGGVVNVPANLPLAISVEAVSGVLHLTEMPTLARHSKEGPAVVRISTTRGREGGAGTVHCVRLQGGGEVALLETTMEAEGAAAACQVDDAEGNFMLLRETPGPSPPPPPGGSASIQERDTIAVLPDGVWSEFRSTWTEVADSYDEWPMWRKVLVPIVAILILLCMVGAVAALCCCFCCRGRKRGQLQPPPPMQERNVFL
eukprot:CAMPEP_0117688588 /NCGR_PEP_ID=MMETSP0804-20121206/23933_1 /TAXON_ID=1074897 /ORGANISM="Tetraselmis astigmatica, Strain CCMP880" /LENGTH=1741 /DNA_ID=CAMNT_0005501097 /DNA_START=142 /DNA_END=5363 /DNA_ORIENTATION=-